jgi:hypothetical protein
VSAGAGAPSVLGATLLISGITISNFFFWMSDVSREISSSLISSKVNVLLWTKLYDEVNPYSNLLSSSLVLITARGLFMSIYLYLTFTLVFDLCGFTV